MPNSSFMLVMSARPNNGKPASAWAMPTVSLVNHLKIHRYDSNLKDLALDDFVHDAMPEEEMVIRDTSTSSTNSDVNLNIDVRLSLTYNFEPFIISAYGTFNRFGYSNGRNSGHLQSWHVNSSVGGQVLTITNIAHKKSMCAIYATNKLKYIKTNNNYSFFPQLCSIFAKRMRK